LSKRFFLDDALLSLLHVSGDTVGLDKGIGFLDVVLLGILNEMFLELLLVVGDGILSRSNTNFNYELASNDTDLYTVSLNHIGQQRLIHLLTISLGGHES
jgi:hypothetical protein